MTKNLWNANNMSPNSVEKRELVNSRKNMIRNDIVFLKTDTIVWRNVIYFILLHLSALYGLYLILFHVKMLTILWSYVVFVANVKGITAGVHRLWSHRSYKAKFPLRVYLALCNALAFQNSIFEWSRDHRLHHKYSETDADPHNAKRGFFFAHIGWLLCRKHPDVIKKGKVIDVSDLLADPVVYYQKKYYLHLVLIMCFLLPMYVPYKLWDETLQNAFFVSSILRYVILLHFTWLVNSAAHLWGDKPYDKNINPSDNLLVSTLSVGEGFHNYHHTFPWDYMASEWGWQKNVTGFFIDMWAAIGLAYDLKRIPKTIVEKRRKTVGDGSTPWYDESTAPADLKSL